MNLTVDARQEITERKVEMLRAAPSRVAAEVYDARARNLETHARRSFVEWGLICLEMSERSLWAELGDPETGEVYHSFDQWLASVASVSRSTAYSAMGTLRRLRDVPIEEVRAMPRCNAVTLAQLSTAVRREPDVLHAAKTMSEDAFVQHVQAAHPEQHLESRRRIVLVLPESAHTVVERAIGACMEQEECTREEAVEAICVSYLEIHTEAVHV